MICGNNVLTGGHVFVYLLRVSLASLIDGEGVFINYYGKNV